MRKLENAELHGSFVSEMQDACQGTAWEVTVSHWGNNEMIWIAISHTTETVNQRYHRSGPNQYAPEIYFDEDIFQERAWQIRIQTTSYGALRISEIEKFAAAYTQAVEFVRKLTTIVTKYYGCGTNGGADK